MMVIAAVLLVSGCCCCSSIVSPLVETTPEATLSPTPDGVAYGYNGLEGAWGDTGATGDIVDAAGNFVGDAYGAEAYRFYADGTYQYRIIGSGLAISGLAEVRGQYRVDGDTLQLYDNKENWYPAMGDSKPGFKNKDYPDESYRFRLDDGGDTLVLIDEGGVESFYHWVDVTD